MGTRVLPFRRLTWRGKSSRLLRMFEDARMSEHARERLRSSLAWRGPGEREVLQMQVIFEVLRTKGFFTPASLRTYLERLDPRDARQGYKHQSPGPSVRR